MAEFAPVSLTHRFSSLDLVQVPTAVPNVGFAIDDYSQEGALRQPVGAVAVRPVREDQPFAGKAAELSLIHI